MARLKLPTIVGNTVEVVGILFAFSLLLRAPYVLTTSLRFLLYLIAMGAFVFFPHGLAHYITGRLVGVRFKHYFLAKSAVSKLKLPHFSTLANQLLVLALKIDRAFLRSVSNGRRAVMFVSGAVASMFLSFIVPVGSIGRVPILVSAVLFLVGGANAAFDLYYSPKAGDISRIKQSN